MQPGDLVSQEQIVARASLEGELCLVRIAENLGIPAKDIGKTLQVSLGAAVREGDLLAEVRGLWGLFRSTVVAPISGTVEFVTESTGHMGIRAAPRKLELSAYLGGKVVEVGGNRSVVIEAEASFVQGIFGVGGERIGSIDDRTLRHYVGRDIGVAVTGDEDVSMTIIITEGFGSLPMGLRVWETLRAMNGARASINGATQVRAGAVRPEILSVATTERSMSFETSGANGGLRVGSRVRLIRVPFFGEIGTVQELPHDLQQIETGAWARVLRATLDDGRPVLVPRANVELV